MPSNKETEGTSTRIQSYNEFYLYYLSEHADERCRSLHYIGTSLTFVFLGLAIFVSAWYFLAMPLAGYSFAWYAHFFVEKNRPATFTYPFWSLVSDYKMFFSWLGGKLDNQLKEAGVS